MYHIQLYLFSLLMKIHTCLSLSLCAMLFRIRMGCGLDGNYHDIGKGKEGLLVRLQIVRVLSTSCGGM
jgi:hypothetical protein